MELMVGGEKEREVERGEGKKEKRRGRSGGNFSLSFVPLATPKEKQENSLGIKLLADADDDGVVPLAVPPRSPRSADAGEASQQAAIAFGVLAAALPPTTTTPTPPMAKSDAPSSGLERFFGEDGA